jgi:flagellar motor switch protein FliM
VTVTEAQTARAGGRDLLVDAANMSIDQLPMLPVIFNRVSSQFAERLRALGPSLPFVTVNAIESTRVGAALDSYDMRAIAGMFQVPEWDNRVVGGFDRDFVFTLVEMLFGGDGAEPPLDEARALTGIEVQVAHFAFEQLGLALQGAFSMLGPSRFRFERSETRMDFAAAGRRSHPAVVARFILQALNRGGEMFVIVPQSALAQFRPVLSRKATRDSAAIDPAWARKIGQEVGRTEVAVRAILESHDYTLGDIAGLHVGQVLAMPATLKSRVTVESNAQPLFLAYLGQADGYHTLCIDEPIDQEREFLNDMLGG